MKFKLTEQVIKGVYSNELCFVDAKYDEKTKTNITLGVSIDIIPKLLGFPVEAETLDNLIRFHSEGRVFDIPFQHSEFGNYEEGILNKIGIKHLFSLKTLKSIQEFYFVDDYSNETTIFEFDLDMGVNYD